MNAEHLKLRIPLILELGFRKEALPALKSYIELLWASNEELNLISRKMTFEDLIDNHIIDCLLPLKHFPQGIQNVADFGTGGGMPAIIYAIQFPQVRFDLYEKSPKKQDFLEKCSHISSNIQIHGEIPVSLEDTDIVTARAFKPIDVLLDMSRDYFNLGGKYFLLKGRREKIDEELLLARKKFKSLKVEIIPLATPLFEVERHLVLI
jgi:16S rRNA (guanine527-N7)-methyltransferase